MSQKIKLILADKHELLRKSLVALLNTKSEFDLIAEVGDGKALLELLKRMHTDIVLLDSQIPIMDTKTTMEIIHRRFPETRIIIMSNESNAQLQADYMAHGANGFLGKDCSVETLFDAILKVKSDGFYFSDSTSKALLETILKDKQHSKNPDSINFNDRETEIIKKICDGKTNKEIALNLHLSPSTIDFYRTKIYGKTKCNNSTGLLKYALKNGIVELS
jgi:two-component system, NarL family, response regulator DegU